MFPGEAPQLLLVPRDAPEAPGRRILATPADGMDRPRKPRSNGGPEGPWWRRPIRPD